MFPPILDKVLGLVDKALQAACVALLSVIAFAVTFQVAARYVVSTSTPWTVELAAICFVWLSMFAIALGVRRGRHMVLDVFEYAPYRRWLVVTVDLVSGLAVIAILFALMYFGFAGLKASFSRTLPGLKISNGWMNLGVPVGCAIALVFAVEALWRRLLAKDDKNPLPQDLIFGSEDDLKVKGEI